MKPGEGSVRCLKGLKGIPEVKHTYATIGAGDTGTVRDAKVYVKLAERKDRKRHQKDVQKEVRHHLLKIPGILPSIGEAGGIDTRKPLLVNVRGDDIALLKKYAAELERENLSDPGDR